MLPLINLLYFLASVAATGSDIDPSDAVFHGMASFLLCAFVFALVILNTINALRSLAIAVTSAVPQALIYIRDIATEPITIAMNMISSSPRTPTSPSAPNHGLCDLETERVGMSSRDVKAKRRFKLPASKHTTPLLLSHGGAVPGMSCVIM